MNRRGPAAAARAVMFHLPRFRVWLATGAALAAGVGLWLLWSYSPLVGIVYATHGGVRLTLDLDYPAERHPSLPVVIFAPPEAAWPRFLTGAEPRCRALRQALTEHGYVMATVRYRAPGRYPFPAAVEDGKAAVRWLRRNAARYGLDGDHIGGVGVSSGGYGLCMLGTTRPSDGFEGEDDDPSVSTRLQAVVTLGAPADFTTRVWTDKMESADLRPFLQASYASAPGAYARASPGTYATADASPFLLFHSNEDTMVPVEMARSFAARLRRAGASVELVEVNSLEHVWLGDKLDRAIERTIDFFDGHLKPSPGGGPARPDTRPASPPG